MSHPDYPSSGFFEFRFWAISYVLLAFGIFPAISTSSSNEINSRNSPTVLPAKHFNATIDAILLSFAMKIIGTNEEAITQILMKRSYEQRMEIANEYRKLNGKTLRFAFKSELGGSFLDVMLALIRERPIYYATILNDAIRGLGTKEEILIEILCTLNNSEIRDVKKVYEIRHEVLEEDIEEDTSDEFLKLLKELLKGNRDESGVTNLKKATDDAKALIAAGTGKIGVNGMVFYNIFTTRSLEQLKLTFNEYQRLDKQTIESALKKEFLGDTRSALLTIAAVSQNAPAYFAALLHDSMSGVIRDDKGLIRVIVRRCEVDMGAIKVEYASLFQGKDLEDDVYAYSSGDFRRILLGLISGRELPPVPLLDLWRQNASRRSNVGRVVGRKM